jgi:hypothetical protein
MFSSPRPAPVDAAVLVGPFIFQSGAERLLRRYWLARAGRAVLWLRQDGWDEPHAAGVVD